MQPKLLFVTYGGGHAKLILQLVKKALNKNYDVEVLALTTARESFVENGIDCLGFVDILQLFDSESRGQAIEYGEKLYRPGGNVTKEESVAYLGLSYFELVEEFGVAEAKHRFELQGRACFLPLKSLRKLLQKNKPNVVVTTVSPRAEMASILSAKELGIGTVCIHDFINEISTKRILETEPNHVCVLTRTLCNYIVKNNSNIQVEVTGNPAFDRLTDLSSDGVLDSILPNRKTILWAAQKEHGLHPFTQAVGDEMLPRKVEGYLNEFARQNDVNMILRSHPNDPIDYSTLSYCIDGNPFDLDQSLLKADIVVTISSTVGYEGLLLGKPLITIGNATINVDGPYGKLGLATQVDDLSKLSEELIKQLNNPSLPQNFDFNQAGNATDRVFSVIESCIYE